MGEVLLAPRRWMLVNMQIRANSDPDSPAPTKASIASVDIEKS